MNIMELGALGEFVGSVGVVATLVYLAVQIRQNTRATQTASHHAITDSLNQGNVAQATDPELARIWLAGCEDRGALSDVDRHRLDMLLLAYFHVFDSLFYAATRGAGERSLLLAEEKGFAHLMMLPGVQEWWQENPYAFSAEFRSYMEGFSTALAGRDNDAERNPNG